jgi:hypothetical protein
LDYGIGIDIQIFVNKHGVIFQKLIYKTAADIVQSMSSYFDLKALSSECNFSEITQIPKMFVEIQSLQDSISRIDSDIAELGMVNNINFLDLFRSLSFR